MTNDVDTLATALYATTDDMLKEHPDLAPWRPPVGNTPRLSDAELVTLATMQAIGARVLAQAPWWSRLGRKTGRSGTTASSRAATATLSPPRRRPGAADRRGSHATGD
ncbi:hypothetical protein ACFWWT_44785 [Streptomyces sp. NPDC058676]|uniref:hypothetical protein n=1 Tax=unclassified Streptomyces TaxID=2593676 RepID=UPI0036485447